MHILLSIQPIACVLSSPGALPGLACCFVHRSRCCLRREPLPLTRPPLPLHGNSPPAFVAVNAESTPTAEAAVNCLEERYPQSLIGFDHLAFRTFGVRLCSQPARPTSGTSGH